MGDILLNAPAKEFAPRTDPAEAKRLRAAATAVNSFIVAGGSLVSK